MITRIVATAAVLATTFTMAMPVFAQDNTADELFELLRLPEIIDVMRDEGLGYGDTIGSDLFGGEPSGDWAATVARIYDYDTMIDMVRTDFDISMDGVDVAPIIDFFASDQGQMIVELEVSARRALLDDAVEEASKDAVLTAAANEDARLALVGEFIETNNLIDTNVAGALNSNLAFYSGLLDGGAFSGALSEDQILTDVWSQEGEIRENTSEWIYSFLFMAYDPLDEEDLQAYIAFSEARLPVR